MSTRIAVVGDIHGNLPALESAIRATSEKGFDSRIFIGDLLTYGPWVEEILDIIAELSACADNVILRGNHDKIYDDLLSGQTTEYLAKLRNWIKESVDLSVARIDSKIWNSIKFQDFFECESCYFGHANPFGFENWTYLNEHSEIAKASAVLRENNALLGVFGHTHRVKANSVFDTGVVDHSMSELIGRWQKFEKEQLKAVPLILNCGSVGQPRDVSHKEHILWLEVSESYIDVMFEPIFFKKSGYKEKIERMPLSSKAKTRIWNFQVN